MKTEKEDRIENSIRLEINWIQKVLRNNPDYIVIITSTSFRLILKDNIRMENTFMKLVKKLAYSNYESSFHDKEK